MEDLAHPSSRTMACRCGVASLHMIFKAMVWNPGWYSVFGIVFICLSTGALTLSGQSATVPDTLRIRLGDYNNDTLWIGESRARRVEPKLMALREADQFFTFPIPPHWPDGMYGVEMRRSPQARPEYGTFWLLKGEGSFVIRTNPGSFHADADVEGSPENQAYFRYMGQYENMARQMAAASDQWHLLPDDASYTALRTAEDKMERFQKGVIRRHQGTATARLVEQTRFQTPPAELTDPMDRLAWYRSHFFDGMDLSSPDLLTQPLRIDRLDYYLMMLPYPDSRTLLAMADSLLVRLSRENSPFYTFYVPYLIAVTENLSRTGMDELYVHLVREYALAGKVPGLPEDRREFLRLNAERKARLFMGRKAPNLALKDREGQPVSLYDLPSNWTLLVFWLPDCQVCGRDLPRIRELWQRYADKGLQVVAVCGRSGPGSDECWSKASDLQLPEAWKILYDPDRQSRYASLYNVRSYPNLFLLDGQRNIRFKQAGSTPPATLEKLLFQAFTED